MVINKGIRYSVRFLENRNFSCIKKSSSQLISRAMSITPDKMDDVLHDVINNKGILTLNRPKQLNSMNLKSVMIITKKLLEWEGKVDMVIIKGEGRAFCAGGDVFSVTSGGPKKGKELFKNEYILNGIISQYLIPYVALIDGITMGGGVGISVHGQVRVATERTVFAMPETLLGLFPDVGVSHVLSRMPHKLGIFLGLTGHRLKGIDVVKAGIATHYIKSENISKLFYDLIKLKDPKTSLNEFLSNNTVDISSSEFSLNSHLGLIERTFSAPTVEEIFRRLQNDGSKFALQTLDQLKKMSPLSLKISKTVMEMYKNMTLLECLTIDNRLAAAAVEARVSQDLYEGARALLLDKDNNPKWNPATLEEVTDEIVEQVFKKLSPEEEIDFTQHVNELKRQIRSKI